ncbi:antitoxin CptB [Vulcaniibacterium tengchongense]|uniref:FAD assembly factor SdhE n=2 Tax=Vulcaniibacterium tengchongense TaxID=1273429 RepID=A0A3N4VXD3_9GAMM|nr:antitoxin CptB [Vulcaniibacterium tengchongense]
MASPPLNDPAGTVAGDGAMRDGEDRELSRLRWRCRRGMRELDRLLERYLDRAWRQAPDAERGVFLRLLETEDDKLWRWFMGYETCADGDLERLVQRIRELPA